MPPYDITFDPRRFDIDAIHAFLTRSYWSPGIPREVVERAIANSLCVGVLHDTAQGAEQVAEQVAFARVVTDRATFAYLADVYVLEAHRGQGLAQQMLRALLAHPELQGLRRLMLATRDAHGLYARFGFQALSAPDRMMEIRVPNPYPQA